MYVGLPSPLFTFQLLGSTFDGSSPFLTFFTGLFCVFRNLSNLASGGFLFYCLSFYLLLFHIRNFEVKIFKCKKLIGSLGRLHEL